MIMPEDREAGLPMTALLRISELGGGIPEPIAGRRKAASLRSFSGLAGSRCQSPAFGRRGNSRTGQTEVETGLSSTSIIPTSG